MTELNALSYCQLDVKLMLSIHHNDVQTVTNLLSLCKVDPDTYFRMAMSELPAVMLSIDRGNYEIGTFFSNYLTFLKSNLDNKSKSHCS